MSILPPNTTWSPLSSALRPAAAEPVRNRSGQTFVDSDQRRGENHRAGVLPLSQESSQDGQRQHRASDQDSPAGSPLWYQGNPDPAIAPSKGIGTLVSVQQSAQPEGNIPLPVNTYQNRIAAYDRVERLSPGPDSRPEIFTLTTDGEEQEVDAYRRIDVSI